MAKQNGRVDRLEESMSALAAAQTSFLQSQSSMLQTQASMLQQIYELERETARRFQNVEAILFQHSQILQDLIRKIDALPEAVKQKIGFGKE